MTSTAAATSWIWSRRWHTSARVNKIAVVYNHDCEGIEELADYPVQIKVGADMENVLLGLDFILFAQTIALMKSLSLGITPG